MTTNQPPAVAELSDDELIEAYVTARGTMLFMPKPGEREAFNRHRETLHAELKRRLARHAVAGHISDEDVIRYFAEGARNRWHDDPETAARGQQVFDTYRDILRARLAQSAVAEGMVVIPREEYRSLLVQAVDCCGSGGDEYADEVLAEYDAALAPEQSS